MINQFQGNRILNKKGVGPLGPSIIKLEKTEFKSKILDFVSNKTYRTIEKKIAMKMTKETYNFDIISKSMKILFLD